jgi:hypothetical protein
LYSQTSAELKVAQGGDNASSIPNYLVNTIHLQIHSAPSSTVRNCGHPCTRRQTIDLEGMGLAAGDAYTVWLRETNAARVVGKGPESPPHGLASLKVSASSFNRQAPGLSSESNALTITMDNTPPTVPSDLTPCTPLGLVSPTTQVSWFQPQGANVSWCWNSPVRRAALGTAHLINHCRCNFAH